MSKVNFSNFLHSKHMKFLRSKRRLKVGENKLIVKKRHEATFASSSESVFKPNFVSMHFKEKMLTE